MIRYQSYQCGIETRSFIPEISMLTAISRTNVELKLHTAKCTRKILFTISRTNVELKRR